MLGSDIIGWVRDLLEDPEYSESVILEAANWFVFELCNNNRLRIMEASASISIAANATTAAFPATMMYLLEAYVTAPSVYEVADMYTDYKSFMRSYANFATASPAQIGTWTDFANALRFAAPVLANSTMQVDFIRPPLAMVADTSTCEIPSRYQELVTKGTLARIQEINDDYDEAAQERDNLQPLVTAFIRNEARGGLIAGPKRIRTSMSRGGRGGRGTWRADRDF